MIPVEKASKEVVHHNKKNSGVLISYHDIESAVGCVSLAGRLDVRSVPQIEQVFESMTSLRKKSVIVDLGGVELMNSVGLGMLISNANALAVHGAHMILFNPQPRVAKVIRIAGVEQLLPIEYDLAAALKRCRS